MGPSDQTISTYDQNAARFAEQYETVSAATAWNPFRDLIPPPSGKIAVDIGAGSGRDAAWLASLGFEVVAAEPAAGLRREGERRGCTSGRLTERAPSERWLLS